jgi:hypothetical protein
MKLEAGMTVGYTSPYTEMANGIRYTGPMANGEAMGRWMIGVVEYTTWKYAYVTIIVDTMMSENGKHWSYDYDYSPTLRYRVDTAHPNNANIQILDDHLD